MVQEDLFRREQWDELLEAALTTNPHDFDPQMPWDWVIAKSTIGQEDGLRTQWWNSRIVSSCSRGLPNKAAQLVHSLEGYVTPSFSEGPAGRRSSARSRTPTERPPASRLPPPPAVPGAGDKSSEICDMWNGGEKGCGLKQSEKCRWGRRHVCSICGSADHPACEHDSFKRSGAPKVAAKGAGKPGWKW